MSLTLYMYECEYEMSRLRIIKPLSLVCMNDEILNDVKKVIYVVTP